MLRPPSINLNYEPPSYQVSEDSEIKYQLLSDPEPRAKYVPVLSNTSTIPHELHSHYDEGLNELKKMGARGLGGKFQVCLALDISASMQDENKFFYNEQRILADKYPLQKLINQALSLGYLLDDDSFVTLFAFGDQAYGPLKVNHSNYETITEHFYQNNGRKYLKDHTDYTSVINAILHHYTDEKKPQEIRSMDPVLVIFVTDGEANPVLEGEKIMTHDSKAEFQPYLLPTKRPKNQIDALNQIQEAFAKTSTLPFYFAILGFEGEALNHIPKDQQFSSLKEAANRYKKNKNTIPQNIDLLLLDHPEDLQMHHLIRKLPHWMIQAYNQKITSLDVHKLMDLKTFNNYQKSFNSCWANFFCCATDDFQLEHHAEEHHHGPHDQKMR